jgi:hypothetical protein
MHRGPPSCTSAAHHQFRQRRKPHTHPHPTPRQRTHEGGQHADTRTTKVKETMQHDMYRHTFNPEIEEGHDRYAGKHTAQSRAHTRDKTNTDTRRNQVSSIAHSTAVPDHRLCQRSGDSSPRCGAAQHIGSGTAEHRTPALQPRHALFPREPPCKLAVWSAMVAPWVRAARIAFDSFVR